jgi:hypothetical protein
MNKRLQMLFLNNGLHLLNRYLRKKLQKNGNASKASEIAARTKHA